MDAEEQVRMLESESEEGVPDAVRQAKLDPKKYRRIQQIVPAYPGIKAAFINPENGLPVIRPIIAWALTEVRSPQDNDVVLGEVLTGVTYTEFRTELVDDPEHLTFYRYGDVGEAEDALRLAAVSWWDENKDTLS